MKLWNISSKEIVQLYNNKTIIIKPQSIEDYNDDLAVFLLNKKNIRGQGLVQLKETDKKEDRYREAKKNIYIWATECYQNFERHCEEREAQRLQPLKPHKEVLEYKKLIDEYETWEANGSEVEDKYKTTSTVGVVYACPFCPSEFDNKEQYFEHLKTHTKEEPLVNSGTTHDKSEGKSR